MAHRVIKVAKGKVTSIRASSVMIFRNTRRGGRSFFQVKHPDGREKPCLQIEEAVSFFRDDDLAERIIEAFKMEMPTPRALRQLFPGFMVTFEKEGSQRLRSRPRR